MRRRRVGGGGNFGLFLLAFQLLNFFTYLSARNEFLPATIGFLALNVAAYLRPDLGRTLRWPSIDASCVSFQRVVVQGEWIRVLFAPFVHADSWHLYYNMASFIWKARTLEKHYGSGYFVYLVTVFSVLTSLLYVAINYSIVELFNSYSAAVSCAVGFSGVIFAMKVLTTHLQPGGMTWVMGIPIPKRLAVWAELVLISVLVPRASFVGHLAGILVGLAFVGGPLKRVMDVPWLLLQGGDTLNFSSGRQSYTYTAQPSGRRNADSRSHLNRANTGRQRWNESRMREEEEELQEAICRSLTDQDNPREYSDSRQEHYQRPPPYNPYYVEGADPASRDGDTQPPGNVSHAGGRHGDAPSTWSLSSSDHNAEHSHSAQDVREARLRRFDKRH